jgi:cysteine desulfurase
MAACLRSNYGNPSSLHIGGRRARLAVDQARQCVADVLGCNFIDVYFTSGGTEGNNTVILGVFEAAGWRGHMVTTAIEHDSVLEACAAVQSRGGEVTYVPAGPDGRVRAEDVAAAIRPGTLLVSVMHANNETGAIQPVAEIAALARRAGVPLHTDAVQSFGKIPTSVDELGCEFLTLSAHKLGGPKGAGALYWRGGTKLAPLVRGGQQQRRLRPGTEAVHQIVGLGAAARLAAGRMAQVWRRLAELRHEAVAGLRMLWPSVRINEAPSPWQLPGTISATFPGISALSLLAGLDYRGVEVSLGAACTSQRIEPSHVLLGMGLGDDDARSTIRISMGSATARGDVGRLLAALKSVLAGDPPNLSWLPPEQLTAGRLREAFVIDLRLAYERAITPGIPQARCWPNIGFESHFGQIPRSREVILVCSTGVFSFEAGYRLALAGHPAVRVVRGGYGALCATCPQLLAELARAG